MQNLFKEAWINTSEWQMRNRFYHSEHNNDNYYHICWLIC